ncbi:MAG TPA: ATP-binding cassette domain-containing protein [Terracidiphilus sp.]|nr:ATP-binding cassette domain-containing protein [Terracidiphilus sp.]
MLEFTLEVRRGAFHLDVQCRFASEWTVVFGPSGAGKSTLLRLLAGLERPDRGEIALDGTVLTGTPQRVHVKPGKRQIGLVAQEPALFPHLTVLANVAYGLAAMDRAGRDARVDEMLDLVGAKDLVDRRPRNLSGGEAQRVALARALATRPRLLLLDEPFSALDGAASDALLARLQPWLREHRIQTVMVTHDATDAYAMGAEVALLREGRVAALGPVGDALASERARIVARLDGA